MIESREVLKIVVVGHVDHGKSTLIGRLLYDTKSLPEGAIDKVKRISKETGKPFEYAYLLDAFEEEQKQGITIDTTQIQFFTKKRDYVIIDAPGHKEFLKNMISGAANAEAALLLIDANEGIQEQSKRHGYILSLLGIKKVYVIVNKMDLIDYSEERFNKIYNNMNTFLNNLNIYPLKYIPISAFNGENVARKSDKMPWYKGSTVLEALDEFEKDKDLTDKPLRFPIQDVYKFDDRRIIAGKIETGKLKVGDEILISPSNRTTKVKSIEHFKERAENDTVEAGMSVGITVTDEFFNQRGEFITKKDNPPLISDLFRANIFWMGKNPLVLDKKYKLKLVTQEVECKIYSINKVIDATTIDTLEGAVKVELNGVAEVTIQTKEPICFDEFKDDHATGRFVIVDGYDVCGGGIISGAEEDKQIVSRFIKGGTKVKADCFNEYYYILSEGIIKPEIKNAANYNIGDKVPVKGDTYNYPESFNILDLNSKIVSQIRDSKLYDIVSLENYNSFDAEFVTTKGFSIRINSQVDFEKFKTDLEKPTSEQDTYSAEFYDKWFDFSRNRNIKYK